MPRKKPAKGGSASGGKSKEKKETGEYGEVFFSWKFSEYPQYERSKNWYVWASIVVVILLIYSIFSGNFLFGLITLIAALIILIFQRSNDEVEFKIAEDGILVNKKLYPYKDIKNFYIIYEPPEVKTLYFELSSFFQPRIPVDLVDQNPVKIREVLLQYIEEDIDRENEPVSDQTSRMFKL